MIGALLIIYIRMSRMPKGAIHIYRHRDYDFGGGSCFFSHPVGGHDFFFHLMGGHDFS